MSSLTAEAAESVESVENPFFHKGLKLFFIPFNKIKFFHNHPFRLYVGERLEDMVQSIKKNGIITPLIVRRIVDPEFDFEMLAGHNRMNAGQIAGLDGAWCLVKENLTDQDAWVYVIETNLLQRSFVELLPSEKAVVLTTRYTEMFSQGKRNDILKELKLLEGSNTTCGTECHKLSREKIGHDYDLKGRAVANYIRINKLIDTLKLRLDNGEFTLKVGVELSFISDKGQEVIDTVLDNSTYRINMQKASLLREYDKTVPLDVATCLKALEKPMASKKTLSVVKLNKDVFSKYLSPNVTEKEIEQIVCEALELYFSTRNGAVG